MTKIVIADDETNILTLLEIMLRDLDATIFSAENGEEAISLALKEKPDLIISDIVMPKVNGFEVCKRIRKETSLEETPIILLSALGDEYNKLTGFEEGADDYIIKPFNVEDLKARSQTLIEKFQSKKKAAPLPTNRVSRETRYCSTGNPELDNSLKGGIPVGSNILIVGETGSGKSTFCRNFITKGLLNKASSLIIAIDDDPKKTRKKLEENPKITTEKYEKENLLRFIDAYSWSSLTPNENEKFAVSGTLELNQLAGIISDASNEIGQSIQTKQGGRRLIDSISSLLISFELGATQRFLNQIARTGVAFGGVTTLFVLEEGTVDETTLNNVKYIMDGVIEFKSENSERKCRVSSMKWSSFDPSWVSTQH
ncbi:hypothetical protein CL658_05395 [bacterium]|nr:hypothetical protein [bacterium]|tara:strand:+ start:360 stop:1469 length:1110 start_codon:yes stop_codon:yes gene_type:complete